VGDMEEKHAPTLVDFCIGKAIVQIVAGNEHTAMLSGARKKQANNLFRSIYVCTGLVALLATSCRTACDSAGTVLGVCYSNTFSLYCWLL